MDILVAAQLVGELRKHRSIPALSTDKGLSLLDLLTSANIPESSRFYEELPRNEQLIEENDRRYHYFSLRRILRNNVATGYCHSAAKRTWVGFIGLVGSFSSNVLTRGIRADRNLVRMMAESVHPFSLLGKLETYDHGNPKDRLFVITRPILVVPKATSPKDKNAIADCEEENTMYAEERGILLRHPRRISPEEYSNRGLGAY